jgi:hypothetical protein
LRVVDLAANFSLRQGLWIEDLRTPPGQECSNGSLILLAVVLWRTLFELDRDLQVRCLLERSVAANFLNIALGEHDPPIHAVQK